jgi:hypothetical protein
LLSIAEKMIVESRHQSADLLTRFGSSTISGMHSWYKAGRILALGGSRKADNETTPLR